ncbi:MAG: hypothetical protein Q8Q18_01045 [bacterium]|nr:hypothetical protein [bacterium]
MKTHNSGGSIADALIVLGFMFALFLVWVALGGPRPNITPYTEGFPNTPTISTSTVEQTPITDIYDTTTTTSTSTDALNERNIEIFGIIFGLMLLGAAFFSNQAGTALPPGKPKR